MSSAVSDADGDTVRCRWSESNQGECAGVCQLFPATLDRVGYRLHATVTNVMHQTPFLNTRPCPLA